MSDLRDDLLDLCHAIGDPAEDQAILAEGNASALASDETFWVKASGTNLQSLAADGLTEVRFEPILEALEGPDLGDAEIRALLDTSRVDPAAKRPSVETFMHAFLLRLPEVRFVGHSHPTALLSLLCLEDAADYARLRLFPDEIVCCGPESIFIPYVDPGLPLARAIADGVLNYIERRNERPKTIWLQNHGLIALGASSGEVESAMRMQVKAVRVLIAMLQSGMTPRFLSESEIERIHRRPDEHYRQKLLWMR